MKDVQVSSELGQLVTERPGETMTEAATNEIVGTGKHFTISDFFARWQLLSTGLLQTTDTALTDMLGGAYYPITTYLNVAAVKAKTQNYQQWKGDIELLITVTPPSNAYGLYLFQALPDENFQASNTMTCNGASSDNPWTATQGIHAFIDITTGNSATFKLPFYSHVLSLGLPNDDNQMWRLCLWCLAPIQNAVNSDTIAATYNIYARMPDIDLMVPYYQSGKGASSALKRGLATASKFKEDKTISKTAGKVASMAAMASTIPFLAPFAGPVAAGAASVMSMASMFGFTRESEPEKPTDVHQRSFAPLANVDGKDGSEVVALLQGNNTPIDPAIGGGSHEDEMSFASLFQRWTIIDTFTWDTASSALTNINTIPVNPYFGNQVLGAFYSTTAGYIGFPFSFWRGSMEYKLIIPSSVYHRGMLQVFWTPDVTAVPATDITQILHNEIFDVEAGSEYVFSVDWSVANITLQNLGFISKTTGLGTQNNGFLIFRVISQLQAVGGSAPITCVLLARGMSNMEFGVPRIGGTLYYGSASTIQPMSKVAQFQGKDVGDDEEDDSITFNLVPSSTQNADKIGGSIFGEEIRSLRALAQKMSLVGCFYSSTAWDPTIIVPHFWPPPFTYPATPFYTPPQGADELTPLWTWYGHCAALFTCVRGSTRYKTLAPGLGYGTNFSVQAFPVTASEIPIVNLYRNASNGTVSNVAGGTFCGMQAAGNSGVEFTIPNYQLQLYRGPCDFSWTVSYFSSRNRADVILPLANGNFAGQQVLHFQGAGPDVSLYRFRRVPPMIVHV